jgi:N-acetylmuramoyl-L-alanine amidase
MRIIGGAMQVNIESKKKVVIWFFVFIIMLLNFIFAIEKRSVQSVSSVNNLDNSALNSHIVLAADTAGSILFEENEYFKKYTITCTEEIEEVKWSEDKDYIDIIFDKNDIQDLKLKSENNTKINDIYYDDTKDNLSIRIRKKYNENNFVYTNRNDKRQIIALLAKQDNPFHHSVVLDAGHGGIDKGANFGDIYEKDLTLRIANYASEELKFRGFKVTQTRDADKLLSLKEVGSVVNSALADVFVSIHINENKVSKYKGISTYYYSPNGYQKNDRVKFAKILQSEMVRSGDWQDRGILRQDLAVLRYSKIPCALVECGFLSNSEDRNRLVQDEVLKNLAVNIANGISVYLLNGQTNVE